MKNIATKEIIGALRGCSEAMSDEACEKCAFAGEKPDCDFRLMQAAADRLEALEASRLLRGESA